MKKVVGLCLCLSLSMGAGLLAGCNWRCEPCKECVCPKDKEASESKAIEARSSSSDATKTQTQGKVNADGSGTKVLNIPAKAERRPAIQESDNLLSNPGFEAGLDGWKWLDWSKGWAPFSLSYEQAYEGAASLLLPLRSMDARPTVVWGGVQEIVLDDDIPECIEGYFLVKDWQHHDWKQYLQLVVIDRSHSLGENLGQAQLRYIISGSVDAPLQISNAQYLFVEKTRQAVPPLNTWTHFSVNPRKDYQENWHYTPGKGSELRILFEARFDQRRPGQAPARADVYFDNLYMGPKTATRCAD